MGEFRVWRKRIAHMPHFLALTAKDYFIWLKSRGWTNFEEFGIFIYLGEFGEGKTGSAVRDCYNLCCKYKGLHVITNITLYNFPEDTTILPLNSIWDIINAPENSIILIDELGTIWNSRDFMNKGKKGDAGIPKPVFQFLCQVRHRNVVVLATAQDWADIDVVIRRKVRSVTVCSAWFKHPFTRMITNRVYAAREYDLFYQNPLFPLLTVDEDVYVQTDKLRKLYNTAEMVDTMLRMDYVAPEEVATTQGDISPVVVGSIDKKVQRDLLSRMKKGGL